VNKQAIYDIKKFQMNNSNFSGYTIKKGGRSF